MLETMMNVHFLLWCMAAAGIFGVLGMGATHLAYRRNMKYTQRTGNLKEKWLGLWKTRDRLLHRMNRLVWYPALASTLLFGAAVLISSRVVKEGLPLTYLYVGAVTPVALLLARQILDFSYKEELIMNSLSDYVEQMRTWVEDVPAEQKNDRIFQEEIVDRITESIRQTAATGSHFSRMLSPEEEEIMREIIREFMN